MFTLSGDVEGMWITSHPVYCIYGFHQNQQTNTIMIIGLRSFLVAETHLELNLMNLNKL